MRHIAQSTDSGSIIIWAAVLIIAVVFLFAAIVWLRKKLSPNEDFRAEGFTLSDLRRLQKEGKLSAEEFEVAKNQLVATAKKPAANIAADPPRPD